MSFMSFFIFLPFIIVLILVPYWISNNLPKNEEDDDYDNDTNDSENKDKYDNE